MSMESPFSEEWANFRAAPEVSTEQPSTVEHLERKFGMNDIIIPDDEIERAKSQLEKIGIACSTEVLSVQEQLNPEGTTWRPGEYLLSLKDAVTEQPLERSVVLQAIEVLRNSPQRVTIRLAAL